MRIRKQNSDDAVMVSCRIPDPDAVKPDDWDEDAPAKIEDPDAVKPDGWMDDGPEYIPDPDATMPEDWCEDNSQVPRAYSRSVFSCSGTKKRTENTSLP